MASGAGVRIVPEPHGQRPATARNSVDFPLPVSPTISTRSPGVTLTRRVLDDDVPVRQEDAHAFESKMSVRVQRAFDLLCAFLDRRQVVERFAEARNPMDRRTPVGEPGKIVDEPSHRPLHLG